ncbi:hypothetical protein [Halovivax gelatinilyticus]|nr:hypothetical protein [Halovivax gelatinilyticus]
MGEQLAFCPQCNEERPIRTTVPWQADFCVDCGTDIDDSAT